VAQHRKASRKDGLWIAESLRNPIKVKILWFRVNVEWPSLVVLEHSSMKLKNFKLDCATFEEYY